MTRVMKRRLGDFAVVLVSAAFAIVLALLVHQVGVMRQQLGALESALGDEQSNVEELGGEPVAPDPEDLLEDPEYTPQPGPPGPPGPPGQSLTSPEIQDQFAVYFEAHPYEFEPTAAELTAAFASVLGDHPDLLNEQLYAAMASYLAANPPPPGPPGTDGKDGADGKDGQDGAQGDPGRAPTEDEIRAQVEGYVAEHGLPLCPDGSAAEAQTVLTTNGTVDAVLCVAATTE